MIKKLVHMAQETVEGKMRNPLISCQVMDQPTSMDISLGKVERLVPLLPTRDTHPCHYGILLEDNGPPKAKECCIVLKAAWQ
jgi:hypothetical protein